MTDRILKFIVVLFCLVILVSHYAYAEDSKLVPASLVTAGTVIMPTPAQADSGPVSFPVSSYIKSVFTVILFLGLLLFFLKIVAVKNRGVGGGSGMIKVLDKVQIEAQLALYLVKFKDKVWLISAGTKTTNVIDDVSEMVDFSDYQHEEGSFGDTLKNIIKNNDFLKIKKKKSGNQE